MLRQEILQHCLASFNFWVLPHKILPSSWHCVLVMFWFPKRHPPYLCESGLSVLQAKGRGRGMPRAYLPLRLQHKLGSILGPLPISFTLPPILKWFRSFVNKKTCSNSPLHFMVQGLSPGRNLGLLCTHKNIHITRFTNTIFSYASSPHPCK